MYSAFVTRIKNLRKHSNADRLLCGECFGNTVIVGLDTQPDELGVYFPVDGNLGIEFAQKAVGQMTCCAERMKTGIQLVVISIQRREISRL